METILEFAFWSIWLVVGLVVANVLLRTYLLVKLAAQHRSELQPVLDYANRAAVGDLVLLTVEVDQDQYLCYNAITQEFVCQGADVTEIAQRFNARFPTKTVAILNGNADAVATLQQQFRAKHENLSLQ